MRWSKPKDRTVKLKRKFALFPITIDKQTRWLEWVTIKSVYYDGAWFRDYRGAFQYWGWRDEEFIDGGE